MFFYFILLDFSYAIYEIFFPSHIRSWCVNKLFTYAQIKSAITLLGLKQAFAMKQ